MSGLTDEQIAYQTAHIQDDRAPMVIGVTCMFLGLTFAAVGARLVARRTTRVKLGIDDYCIFVAQFLFVAQAIEMFVLVHYRLGKRTITLTPQLLTPIRKTTFSIQFTYATCITLVKVSILLFFRAVFNLRVPWFKYCWYCSVSFVAAYFIAIYFQICFQCVPIRNLWNPQGGCNVDYTPAMIFGSLNAAIDVMILVLPIPMVWQLNMERKQKIAVCAIFGLGLLVVFVSIIRVPYLKGINHTSSLDRFCKFSLLLLTPRPLTFLARAIKCLYYFQVDAFIWTLAEPGTAIICACLPILRPLFRGCLGLRSHGDSGNKGSYPSQSKGSSGWKSIKNEDTQSASSVQPIASQSGQIRVDHDVAFEYAMDDMPERNIVGGSKAQHREW